MCARLVSRQIKIGTVWEIRHRDLGNGWIIGDKFVVINTRLRRKLRDFVSCGNWTKPHQIKETLVQHCFSHDYLYIEDIDIQSTCVIAK